MCRISVSLQNLAALTTACMSPHRVKLQKHTEVLFICFTKVFLRVYCFHSLEIEILHVIVTVNNTCESL